MQVKKPIETKGDFQGIRGYKVKIGIKIGNWDRGLGRGHWDADLGGERTDDAAASVEVSRDRVTMFGDPLP